MGRCSLKCLQARGAVLPVIVGCSLSKIELSIQCSALASNGPGEEHLTSKDILAVSWPYENVLPGTWRLGEAGSDGGARS